MNRPLKYAMIISGILTAIFILIYFSGGGELSGGILCIPLYLFVGFTIFFWISFLLGKAIWNTEKKVWRWMREEE